ncbi:MAG: helix-turn-helix transcriptional regulator [Thermoleophilia bacterium]
MSDERTQAPPMPDLADWNPLATLSPRQYEVLSIAATGLTNTQVAQRLHLTTHSIKFHLAEAYRKLGVSNRTEAAAVYHRYARGA